MLSHACASCGRPLDAASRSYSSTLRMWIARCPRCGFAVRWAPRAAREPVRVWARLRALNTRLGIALSFGQGAGGFSALTAGLLADFVGSRGARAPLDTAGADDFVRGNLILHVLEQPEFLISAAATALLGTVSALAFLPHRRRLSTIRRWVLAWAIGALPVAVLIGMIGLVGGGQPVLRELEALWTALPATLVLLGSIPLASLALTVAAAPVVDRSLTLVLARQRRAVRARRATTAISVPALSASGGLG